MKFLILTTSKRTLNWRTLDSKLKEIGEALTDSWEVSIQYYDGDVKTSGDRVDRDWLGELTKSYFDHGYDVIGLHMSVKQKRDWGIGATVRGVNINRPTEVGDFWFWADERTKRNGENQFVQTCLHEFSHEYYQQTGLMDLTHSYHAQNNDIKGLFTTFNWFKYQPKRMNLKKQKSILERLVELWERFNAKNAEEGLIHPVSEYSKLISQAYGVKNDKWYPITGHHLGTDYACPIGTPLKAPSSGKVIASGTSPSMGNFCYYQYTYQDQEYVSRFMHLSTVPKRGDYKRGEVIAKTGSSGNVTGPHLHVDIFLEEVRLDLLSKKNWTQLTVDPQEHYSQFT